MTGADQLLTFEADFGDLEDAAGAPEPEEEIEGPPVLRCEMRSPERISRAR
jgi:hypothetical protein